MAAMPTTNGHDAPHLRLLPSAAPTTPLFDTLWLKAAEAQDLLLVLAAALEPLIDKAINEVAGRENIALDTLENIKRNVHLTAILHYRLAYIAKQRDAYIDTSSDPKPEPGEDMPW